MADAQPKHEPDAHAEHHEPGVGERAPEAHDQEDLPLLDEPPSNTPLDLLLNAISGSGGYTFPDAAGEGEGEVVGAGGEGQDEEMALLDDGNGRTLDHARGHGAGEGRAGQDGGQEEDERLEKIKRTLVDRFAGRQDTFSTIEVWHPKTGQKSYGKERRIIQPPPTLRVSGPLLPLLTYATLSAHPNVDSNPARSQFSSQSHRFALGGLPTEPLYPQKDERDRRARALRAQASKAGWGSTLPWERSRTGLRGRDELADGLTFPGLWVGEGAGKDKEFRLELSVAQPGVEVDINGQPVHAVGLQMEVGDEVTQPIDEAALRHVLGSTNMEPLMNLNQAEHGEVLPLLPTVLDSDVDAAVAAAHAAADEHQTQTQDETQTQIETQTQTQIETQTQTQVDSHTQTDTQTQGDAQQPSGSLLPPPAPWATFVSDPLTIVSKPSQKTAKARSMASCLSSSDAFALFVRVNAQTVRTKLLKLEGADTDMPTLTARAAKWTPFRFEVVMRATSAEEEAKGGRSRYYKHDTDQDSNIVTYGSLVRLVDVTSGVKSDLLRLIRVDKNEVIVGQDVGHPVSELQRIGLVRVNEELDLPGVNRWYLSSPGALAGAGEVKTSRARLPNRKSSSSVLPETLEAAREGDGESVPEPDSQSGGPPRKKRKTKRHALARAVIEEEEQGSSASGLVFKEAERRTEVDANGIQTTVETVQDSMCWVLSSVGCFSYTFFNGLGEPGSLPTASLDPVPRLLINPTLHKTNTPATLQLTLSDFFVHDDMGVPQPLSVYIGPIGPLRATTWRSVAPKEKYFDPRSLYDAIPWSGGVDASPTIPADTPVVRSNFPHSVPHVIVSVELPSSDEILRAMQATTPEEVPHDAAEVTDDAWLGVMDPSGELTIQEALHNAGKAAAPSADGEHDMTSILGGQDQPSDVKDDHAVDFEMGQLAQPLMDPDATLHDSAEAVAAAAAVATGHATIGSEPIGTPGSAGVRAAGSPMTEKTTTIAMHRPARSGAKDPRPLPLLLVRPDGVGNGIGWSLERVQGGHAEAESGPSATGAEGSSDWWIRIVQTVARGQALC